MNHTLTWMKFDLEQLEQPKDLLFLQQSNVINGHI